MNPNTSKNRIIGVSILVLLILAAIAVIVINPVIRCFWWVRLNWVFMIRG